MRLNQTKKLLHRGNKKQGNKKGTNRIEDNICKRYFDRGFLSKIY